MASTIIFDAFGTLIQRAKKRENPYARLVSPSASADLRHQVLTRNVPIDVFAKEQGLEHLILLLRREIENEIAALALYPDVLQTLLNCAVPVIKSPSAAIWHLITAPLSVSFYLSWMSSFSAVKSGTPSHNHRSLMRPANACAAGLEMCFSSATASGLISRGHWLGMCARLIDREAGENLEIVLLAGAK